MYYIPILHNGIPIYISTSRIGGFPFLHILSSDYCLHIFYEGHFDWCEVMAQCSFDVHFSSDGEHLFMGIFCHLCVLFEEISTQISCPFFLIGFPFCRLSFCFLYIFLCCAEVFKFNLLIFIYFCFYYCMKWTKKKKNLLQFMSEHVLSLFSSKSFIVSIFTFRSLIHFEFIFVYCVRNCSNFILLPVVAQFFQKSY